MNTEETIGDLCALALTLNHLSCLLVLGEIQPGSLEGVRKAVPEARQEAGLSKCKPVISKVSPCGEGASFPDEENLIPQSYTGRQPRQGSSQPHWLLRPGLQLHHASPLQPSPATPLLITHDL